VFARRYEEALAKFRATLGMEPLYGPTYWEIGRVYYLMRRYAESAAILEEGMRMARQLPLLLMYAGAAYARLGQRDTARAIAAELRAISQRRYISPFYEAHVFGALGEHEESDRLIDRAVELHSCFLIFTRADPIWDPWRDTPGFRELLRKANLDF
jgi:adenylate cyclase